jgi:mannosylglycerate hydrolase MGH1-like protein
MTTNAGQPPPTKEHARLKENVGLVPPWRHWGPYVAERAWGTVREDYSADGSAWEYFTHDVARSRAYRWGEDGLAGICDRYQLLVFALAFWNGRDPILKERAFGLVPSEGNHGEDVKEYYFYLDNTPSHSYMKYLYKYPQNEFPYHHLIEENQRRDGRGPEYELMDTGVFDDDKYFDIFVEYAKAAPEDICIRIEAFNRGPEDAPLHIIPHLWFRNTWGWTDPRDSEPLISAGPAGHGYDSAIASDCSAHIIKNLAFHYQLGARYLYADASGEMLFTNNETNPSRAPIVGAPAPRPYYKDAFHRYVIDGEKSAINEERAGTKACLRYQYVVPAGGSVVVKLRLSTEQLSSPLEEVDQIIAERLAEANEFYNFIQPPNATEDERRIQRQAFAGLLWTKQFYMYDVNRWLNGDDPNNPPPESRYEVRNTHWQHLNSMRILSMPDKWEYPWFAAWDLAFQAIALALIDPEFAKEQLWLMLFEQFQHPNGQLPAYEWDFSDLNPPVHAWACWRIYNMDRIRSGRADRDWLEKCFHKLLINFAWWVNKVDNEGNNIFEGGFLGLDNITVIDRSEKHPAGVVLEQSDATGWMGMFCLNLMRIALELAREDKVYEGLATKFFQHYIYVGAAMKHRGGRDYSLWDDQDGFFYDVLRYPDGSFHKFRVRSLVGLIPLYAIERLEVDWIKPFEQFTENMKWFSENRHDLVERASYRITHEGVDVHVLAIVDPDQTKQILERLIDPDEFLSDYGIRSLSKYHEQHPYVFGNSEVRYEPAESDNKTKGGNSNWRGPIWFATSFLMIESLRKLGKAYGPHFSVRLPDGSGREATLTEIAGEIANRLIRIFTRDEGGHRPVYGGSKKFQEDPNWRDYILFYEYFHGDNGAGIGASHQTGWSALVASLIDEWRR